MASEELTNAPTAEEPLFEPGLKKKKNKKIVDFDVLEGAGAGDENGAEAATAAAGGEATEENPEDLFGGLKKKSKKKKAMPMDLVSLWRSFKMQDPIPIHAHHCSLTCRQGDDTAAPGADGTATDAGVEAAEAVPDGDLDVSASARQMCFKMAHLDSHSWETISFYAVRRYEEEEEEGKEGWI